MAATAQIFEKKYGIISLKTAIVLIHFSKRSLVSWTHIFEKMYRIFFIYLYLLYEWVKWVVFYIVWKVEQLAISLHGFFNVSLNVIIRFQYYFLHSQAFLKALQFYGWFFIYSYQQPFLFFTELESRDIMDATDLISCLSRSTILSQLLCQQWPTQYLSSWLLKQPSYSVWKPFERGILSYGNGNNASIALFSSHRRDDGLTWLNVTVLVLSHFMGFFTKRLNEFIYYYIMSLAKQLNQDYRLSSFNKYGFVSAIHHINLIM